MSPRPREISPELVLVDPELAAVAHTELPEPGPLVRPRATANQPHGTPARRGGVDTPTTRSSWRVALLRTAGVLSLLLNGFWIARLVRDTTPAAEPSAVVTTVREARANAAAALSTVAVQPAAPSPPLTTKASSHRSRHTRTRSADRQTHARTVGDTIASKRRRAGVASRPHSSTLRWKPVAHASYYNLVLWRDGKRVLDLWPRSPRVTVSRPSVKHGPRSRLIAGRYLWFVYPGFGSKASRTYGALAASGVLVVQPKEGNEG